MHRRQSPLPRVWLMTDERIADLAGAVAALPAGSGIVFRHHDTPPGERRKLFDQLRRAAQRRRHILLLADTPLRALQWGAHGSHHRSPRRSRGLRSVAVHNGRELASARAARADLIFVSPVFTTRSHPGIRPLGPVRAALIVGAMRKCVILLGGMTAARWKRAAGYGFHGWAAIDGLSDQKRIAVPT